jgi:release factor family 7
MKHVPSKTELRTLMERQSSPCISLFLPTCRVGADTQQNPLGLRNLMREAESHLLLNDLSTPQVEALLEPVRALLEAELFWLHPDDGLAVFRSSDLFRTYWLPSRFKEQVVVTRHFYLRPLLPFLTDDGRFYLLALSHNHIRLIEGTRFSVSEVDLPEGVPHSLTEAMRYDESFNELQYHSSSSGAVIAKGGRRATVFHGQGVGTDDEKERLLRSFQQVDRGLHRLLRDERAPLVLAGVAYLFPIYREANTYPHLLEEGVHGNPDRESLEVLHKEAWEIVETSFSQSRQVELARYREYAATDRTSNRVREIVTAAYDGRIESLFLADGREQWGTFNTDTRMVHIHQQARFNDDDLLDVAATQTLLHGGSVYVLGRMDMPDEEPLAALLRY